MSSRTESPLLNPPPSPRAPAHPEPAVEDSTAAKTDQAVQKSGLLQRALQAGVDGIKKGVKTILTGGADFVASSAGIDPEALVEAQRKSVEVSAVRKSYSLRCEIIWNGGKWEVSKDLDHEPTPTEQQEWEEIKKTAPEFLELIQELIQPESDEFDVALQSGELVMSSKDKSVPIPKEKYEGKAFTTFVKFLSSQPLKEARRPLPQPVQKQKEKKPKKKQDKVSFRLKSEIPKRKLPLRPGEGLGGDEAEALLFQES